MENPKRYWILLTAPHITDLSPSLAGREYPFGIGFTAINEGDVVYLYRMSEEDWYGWGRVVRKSVIEKDQQPSKKQLRIDVKREVLFGEGQTLKHSRVQQSVRIVDAEKFREIVNQVNELQAIQLEHREVAALNALFRVHGFMSPEDPSASSTKSTDDKNSLSIRKLDAQGNESTLITSGAPTEIPQDQVQNAPATLVLPGPSPWTSGYLLQGQFRLIRRLDRGGFGEVWLAEDIVEASPTACVVKKFIFQHDDANILSEMRRRFEREAQILERLGKDHDQIPSLYAFNTEGEEGYFVQEYVEGLNLVELVHNTGPMTEPQLLDFLDSVLAVLSHVHNGKVIHRDIKPANIIIRKVDGKPVLIDFGTFKEISTTVLDRFGHATTTLVVGTPGYIPNEQMQGLPRLSSDIYALGFTALFLISGKKPAELIDIITGEVEWTDLASVLSPELKTLLSTATDKMADRRFNTAQLMQDEVCRLIKMQEHSAPVSRDNQAEASLLSSRERLKQLRASDEMRLPKLARAPIEEASRKLYDSLRAAAKVEDFAFDENQPAMVTRNGFPASNILLSIYDPSEPGITAQGYHSIEVRDNQFVATYHVDGIEPKEYFKGTIDAPALLDSATTRIVPEIVSALINHYIEQVTRGKELTINDKWEFYKDPRSGWRWHRYAPNGQIAGTSNESYHNRSDCEDNARRNGWLG